MDCGTKCGHLTSIFYACKTSFDEHGDRFCDDKIITTTNGTLEQNNIQLRPIRARRKNFMIDRQNIII